jgi:hypothetical protein
VGASGERPFGKREASGNRFCCCDLADFEDEDENENEYDCERLRRRRNEATRIYFAQSYAEPSLSFHVKGGFKDVLPRSFRAASPEGSRGRNPRLVRRDALPTTRRGMLS